jgi:hypothetical protein
MAGLHKRYEPQCKESVTRKASHWKYGPSPVDKVAKANAVFGIN